MKRASVIAIVTFTVLGAINPAIAANKTVPRDAAVSKQSSGNCSALLPNGWTFGANADASAADGYSPDGKRWVGWALMAVDPNMQPYWQTYGVDRDFYSPIPSAQAMATLRMVAKNLGYSTAISKVGKTVSQGMYKATKVKSPNAVGFLIWADRPYQGDGVSFAYIAAIRGAMAPRGTSDNELLRQMRNGLSIRCTTQLRQSPDPFKPSSGVPKKSRDSYNAQLDTFWAHDPETGQNYSLTNSDLVNTGCGTGNTVAVKIVGNSCRELVPGRSD